MNMFKKVEAKCDQSKSVVWERRDSVRDGVFGVLISVLPTLQTVSKVPPDVVTVCAEESAEKLALDEESLICLVRRDGYCISCWQTSHMLVV